MELTPYIFGFNIILALCDASLGYHLAPLFAQSLSPDPNDPEERERTTRRMRRLLSAVVAVYTLLDCVAFSTKSPGLLLGVTGLITVDMMGQILLRRKLQSQGN